MFAVGSYLPTSTACVGSSWCQHGCSLAIVPWDFPSIMRKHTGNTFNSTTNYTLSDGPTEFRHVGQDFVCIVIRTPESSKAPHKFSKPDAKSVINNEGASLNLGNLVKESKYAHRRMNSQPRTVGGIDLRAWEQWIYLKGVTAAILQKFTYHRTTILISQYFSEFDRWNTARPTYVVRIRWMMFGISWISRVRHRTFFTVIWYHLPSVEQK